MSLENLPRQIGAGSIEFLGVTLEVVVLDDGRRLIVGEGLERVVSAISGTAGPEGKRLAEEFLALIKRAGTQ